MKKSSLKRKPKEPKKPVKPTPKKSVKPTPKKPVKPTPKKPVKPTPKKPVKPTPKKSVKPTPKKSVKPTPKKPAKPTPKKPAKPTPKKSVKPTPKKSVKPTPKKSVKPTPVPLAHDIPREQIDKRFSEAVTQLQSSGYASRYSVHRYESGHVEGQITIEVPRGVTLTKTALDLEDAIGHKKMPGFWLSAGVRFDMSSVEGIGYRRNRGSYDVQVYPQRATSHNFAEVPLIMRHRIAAGASQTLRRKPSSFYIRLYWSPDGERPRRAGQGGKK